MAKRCHVVLDLNTAQVMACCLLDTKPLTMLTYIWSVHPKKYVSMKISFEIEIFSFKINHLKMSPIKCHFVKVSQVNQLIGEEHAKS